MSNETSNPVIEREAASRIADPAAGAKLEPSRATRERRQVVLLGVLSFCVLVVLWHVVLTVFDISPLLFPKPLDVLSRLIDGLTPGPGSLYPDIAITLVELLIGFVIAVVLGTLIGVMMAQWPLFEKLCYPYVFAFQALPKIAIAPIIILWAGFGVPAMVAVGVVIAFFPMMVNAATGFKSVSTGNAMMFKGLCATPLQTFFKLRLPTSLPMLFTGIDLALVYALLGVIIGEFIGGQAGLGVRILVYNTNVDVAGQFSVLVVLCVISVALQLLVGVVRRKALFWTPSEIARSSS